MNRENVLFFLSILSVLGLICTPSPYLGSRKGVLRSKKNVLLANIADVSDSVVAVN